MKNQIKQIVGIVLTTALMTSGTAAEVSLAAAPPVVVQTSPVAGNPAVDPALTEIRVTYSKAMQDRSWSWSTWGEENFPEMVGEPKYLEDGRTCVAKVKLQSGKFYAIWLNSDKFKNFKDADGRSAVPYLLTFSTTAATKVAGDNVEVEHVALRVLAAIRDKEDNVLKELAVDRIKGWRDALPHFAFELRERLRQPDGTSYALRVGESLVEGEYAAVKCTGPKELEGKYLLLFFAKTDQGWRNCSLRNSPPSIGLSKHLAACVAEMQALTATATANEGEWSQLLNEDQRAVLAWTDRQFRSYFDTRTFAGWTEAERAALEVKSIDALKAPRSRDYYQAINTLGVLRSTNGLPALRSIAYERADKNNRDRWMAIRSLGLIGAKADVPELVRLVYHGNINTRWWAQLSLVRITGQNFGPDWSAWGKWWNAQNGQPAYQPEIIRWWNGQAAPDQLAQSLKENDQKFLADLKEKAAGKPGSE